jgi:hypothetical protein
MKTLIDTDILVYATMELADVGLYFRFQEVFLSGKSISIKNSCLFRTINHALNQNETFHFNTVFLLVNRVQIPHHALGFTGLLESRFI